MIDIQKKIIGYNFTPNTTRRIEYIVIHDTGDPGASAQNEHGYFSGGDRGASADFFVDSSNIIQVIDYLKGYSWHCGDGHGAYRISNKNSIGIEMCIETDGQPSAATLNNTLDLVKYLMATLGINADHVVRHYDASHKNCPASMSDNNWADWYAFKVRISRNGWYKDNDIWYYYVNGAMAKNTWSKDSSGRWFYLSLYGPMVTNGWGKDSSNRWFYLGSDGAMVTSIWVTWKGKQYYLGSDGALLVNTTTLDGFKVDSDGAKII